MYHHPEAFRFGEDLPHETLWTLARRSIVGGLWHTPMLPWLTLWLTLSILNFTLSVMTHDSQQHRKPKNCHRWPGAANVWLRLVMAGHWRWQCQWVILFWLTNYKLQIVVRVRVIVRAVESYSHRHRHRQWHRHWHTDTPDYRPIKAGRPLRWIQRPTLATCPLKWIQRPGATDNWRLALSIGLAVLSLRHLQKTVGSPSNLSQSSNSSSRSFCQIKIKIIKLNYNQSSVARGFVICRLFLDKLTVDRLELDLESDSQKIV